MYCMCIARVWVRVCCCVPAWAGSNVKDQGCCHQFCHDMNC
eukprot:SAG11_NODE_11484_length_757_cov_45.735562_1_plen_40_part_01